MFMLSHFDVETVFHLSQCLSPEYNPGRRLAVEIMFYSGVFFVFCVQHRISNWLFLLMSIFFLLFKFSPSGASLSDRSQETNIGEERISRRSLTDSLAVSSMLLLQPQQVSFLL